eukprot:gene18463-biopygen6917
MPFHASALLAPCPWTRFQAGSPDSTIPGTGPTFAAASVASKDAAVPGRQ